MIESIRDDRFGKRGVDGLGDLLGNLGANTAAGVFFGVWPAVKASRLDPVEALRWLELLALWVTPDLGWKGMVLGGGHQPRNVGRHSRCRRCSRVHLVLGPAAVMNA